MGNGTRFGGVALGAMAIVAMLSACVPFDAGDSSDASSETGEEHAADGSRETGLDLCSLVSEETIESFGDFIELADSRADQREVLLPDAETFIGCDTHLGGAQSVSWGVRDPEYISEPAVEFLFTEGEVGDGYDVESAQVGDMSLLIGERVSTLQDEDVFRIAAAFEHDGLDVFIRSTWLRGDVDAATGVRGIVERLIKELDTNIEGRAPEPIDFGDAPCPETDQPALVDALDGEPTLAR